MFAVFPGAEAKGQAHEAASVRFVEHSAAVFDAAHREGKPVFLLISAVWCYWCKYFEREVLADPEVTKYLNRHYLSVFADYDRRPDLVRKYVRGLPMIVLFGADGSPPPLDSNGIMAEALFRAQQAGGRADYGDVARRVLATFGGTARALLSESEDAVARSPDAVYYLRAYARIVGKAPGEEPRR